MNHFMGCFKAIILTMDAITARYKPSAEATLGCMLVQVGIEADHSDQAATFHSCKIASGMKPRGMFGMEILSEYHGVHNDYSQLSYFGELIRVTVTVTVIIFPAISYIIVMGPLQL